jgi:Type II CAAX prenyl endopeptidase Rce1-like
MPGRTMRELVGALVREPGTVWVVLLLADALFILGAVVSIVGLFSPPVPLDARGETGGGGQVVVHAAMFSVSSGTAVGAAWFACWSTRAGAAAFGLRAGRVRGRMIGGIAGAVLGYIAVLVGAGVGTQWVLGLFEIHGRSFPGSLDSSLSSVAANLFDAAGAGVQEELVLFALPIGLLTLRGWRPLPVFAVVLALRVSIHLYYGWGFLFVLPWIAAAFVLYRWIGSVWPFVIGHALYDALIFTASATSGRSDLTLDGLAAAGGVVIVASLVRARRINRTWARINETEGLDHER